jgi:hypothetical protein
MDEIYGGTQERALHARAMQELAEELKLPLEEIRPVYEYHLAQLCGSARVRNFLPVLVIRRVRRAVRQYDQS